MTTKRTFSAHPAINADSNNVMTMDFGAPFTPQVKIFFEEAGDLRGFETFGLPGQAVAAALSLPVLEMTVGLPSFFLFGFGREVKVVGKLDLADYRHNTVRSRRSEVPEGEAYEGCTILDGAGRGIETHQFEEIAAELNTSVDNIRVIDVSVGHVDPEDPTKGLVEKLLSTGLTSADWTSGRIIFLPPGFGPLATVMATAIYGLSEVWPRVIRLNRRDDGSFHVDEIVDPQSLRQFGVRLLKEWEGAVPTMKLSGDIPEIAQVELEHIAKRYGIELK